MATSRRRTTLGSAVSAALPVLWRACARREWSHADLARALEVSSAAIAGLAYGDFKPGRKLAEKLRVMLGVKLHLWDRACPKGWSPPELQHHRRDVPTTGTDG